MSKGVQAAISNACTTAWDDSMGRVLAGLLSPTELVLGKTARAYLMSKRMDLSMAAKAVAVAARPATPSMMTGLLMRADRPCMVHTSAPSQGGICLKQLSWEDISQIKHPCKIARQVQMAAMRGVSTARAWLMQKARALAHSMHR